MLYKVNALYTICKFNCEDTFGACNYVTTENLSSGNFSQYQKFRTDTVNEIKGANNSLKFKANSLLLLLSAAVGLVRVLYILGKA